MMAVFYTYGALVFFLVCGSCSSVREERAAKRAWTEVTEADLKKDYKYLALLMYTSGRGLQTAAYCSGTITSISTVLTFCPKDPEKAYAGLTSVADITDPEKTNKQERRVETVKKEGSIDLRICIVKNWDLTDYVGVLTLRLDDASNPPYTNCLVLSFGAADNAARKQDQQTIDAATVCKIPETNVLAGHLYSEVAASKAVKLDPTDIGGPAVCGGVQRAINKGSQEASAPATECNLYIEVAHYSKWIDGQIKAAEAGESGGTGGTGGNGTSPSSGYSIHSHLNKYSNWKVLLLCLIIIKFLVY